MNNQPDEAYREVQVSEAHFRSFANEDGCWYESKQEVERAIAWPKQKAVLLRWVCGEMGRVLSARERVCMELYYFEGLTLRELGERMGINQTSALRAIFRGTRKLRRAAQESGLRPFRRRRA